MWLILLYIYSTYIDIYDTFPSLQVNLDTKPPTPHAISTPQLSGLLFTFAVIYCRRWNSTQRYLNLTWPDDGCRRQPKHVAVLYKKIRRAIMEFRSFVDCLCTYHKKCRVIQAARHRICCFSQGGGPRTSPKNHLWPFDMKCLDAHALYYLALEVGACCTDSILRTRVIWRQYRIGSATFQANIT